MGHSRGAPDALTLCRDLALAAGNVLRSLAGFGFPLFAPAMYDALGYGKGDTILASVAIAIGIPASVLAYSSDSHRLDRRLMFCSPFLFWKYGERIRNASPFAKHA